MDKKHIASELRNNTTNMNLKKFIDEYISKIKDIESKKCDIDAVELIRFDNCVYYIKSVNFDITGWMLFEIPIFYSHCFYNEKTKQCFDLAVWDIGQVIPRYIDSGNEQDTKTIQEAIEKYGE